MSKKRITHGYFAYKRGFCRCKLCNEANTAYEARRRKERRVRLHTEYDTFGREEIMAYREKDAARLRALWAQEKADKKRGNRG